MKLFYSKTSPFVRKVMACAIAGGLDGQIEIVPIDPWTAPAELTDPNPISQVPTLLTEDGFALYDSPVICEYLDHVGGGALFPPEGPARWRALKQQALADGMLTASVARRQESTRPEEAARSAQMERLGAAVRRGLDALEADVPADHLDIGTISIACALGYLDLRFAHEPWRDGHPRLAAWFETMSARPEIARTAP